MEQALLLACVEPRLASFPLVPILSALFTRSLMMQVIKEQAGKALLGLDVAIWRLCRPAASNLGFLMVFSSDVRRLFLIDFHQKTQGQVSFLFFPFSFLPSFLSVGWFITQ